MKRVFWSFLLMMTVGWAQAQTSRLAILQNARNLVVTTTDKQSHFYLVTTDRAQMLYRHGSRFVIGRDTFPASQIQSMRLKNLTRFALDEDSTEYKGAYSVDHGLLAFRRSFHLNQWNSLIVPFSLTGPQVLETFGADAQLVAFDALTDGDVATVELNTVDLTAEGTALQAGVHYLIRPTREPDLAEGTTTTVVYGSQRVAGPLYVIPEVSLTKGTSSPKNLGLRSGSDQMRLLVSGTYSQTEVSPSARRLFALGEEGLFFEQLDPFVVKAFRSWLVESRNTNGVPLRFYIDGIGEDLTGTSSVYRPLADMLSGRQVVCDMQGRRLENAPRCKGLYIINGKKVIVR